MESGLGQLSRWLQWKICGENSDGKTDLPSLPSLLDSFHGCDLKTHDQEQIALYLVLQVKVHH